jgi:hypothetical protein
MNRKGLLTVVRELLFLVVLISTVVFFTTIFDQPLFLGIFILALAAVVFSLTAFHKRRLNLLLRGGRPSKEVGTFNHKLVSFCLSTRVREEILDQNRQDDLRSFAESLAKGNRADASYFRLRLRFFPFWLCITSVWEAIGNRLSKLRIK